VFLDVDQQSFISALTIVFDHSHTLGSLVIENIPMDDTSLEVLASSNSKTLELLQMKNCPRVSPEGKIRATSQMMKYEYIHSKCFSAHTNVSLILTAGKLCSRPSRPSIPS
jgi:hypothetical protein